MLETIVFLLCIYALWPLYVFTMAMLRAKEANLTTLTAWVLAFPLMVVALILDVLLNFTVFAVLTWDFPQMRVIWVQRNWWKYTINAPTLSGEWTFSQRLARLIRDTGWKGKLSNWIAASLLDPYDHDPKGHIKR
jgi:hypothetical protein